MNVTEAFEGFIEACIKLGAVTFPKVPGKKRGVDAEARVLLTWLRQGEYYDRVESKEPISMRGRLLTFLSKVQDEGLRGEIEETLKHPTY